MDSLNFDASPTVIDVDTPNTSDEELDVVEIDGKKEYIYVMNKKVREHSHFWKTLHASTMNKFENIYTTILNNENAEDTISSIKEIMTDIPRIVSPPRLPCLMYRPKEKLGAKRKAEHIQCVVEKMRESYNSSDGGSVMELTVPEYPKDITGMTNESVQHRLMQGASAIRFVDNLNLCSAFTFGKWLQLGFAQFQHVKEQRVLSEFTSFAQWCREVLDISERRQRDMRKFAFLCEKYNKILRCQLPVCFFIRNQCNLMEYFEDNCDPWNHTYNCNCNECIEYFR